MLLLLKSQEINVTVNTYSWKLHPHRKHYCAAPRLFTTWTVLELFDCTSYLRIRQQFNNNHSVLKNSHCLFCVCVLFYLYGWKGLSPSVKKNLDSQTSPPGSIQGTKGDASVTRTGTAVTAAWALMHCVSGRRVWECVCSVHYDLWLVKTVVIVLIVVPHTPDHHLCLISSAP